MPNIDWIIEILANGVHCATCGKVENHYPDYICNAHTHGMAKYGHMDFQLVLYLHPNQMGYVLNTLGDADATGDDGFRIRRVATENGITVFTSLDTVKVLLDVLEEITFQVSTIDA